MNDSLILNAKLKKDAAKIKKSLEQSGLSDKEISFKLIQKIQTDFLDVLNTLNAINAQPKINHDDYEGRVVFESGSMRLIDFSKNIDKKSPATLFIPSLINRSYILDISEQNSFMKYLESQNINCYLIDWKEPKNEELNFSIEDYIEKHIGQAIDFVYKKHNQKINVSGYCMGGILALCAYFKYAEKISSLAFFATPWNFHSENFARVHISDEMLKIFENIIENSNKIEPAFIQSIFYYLHLNSITNKFKNISSALKNGKDIKTLAAREQWANDGIAMTENLAKTCLINWVHFNETYENKFVCAGNLIDLKKVAVPCFFSIAQKDHITPYDCAIDLYEGIKTQKTLITPNSGHVAMMAGTNAKSETWEPFLKWLGDKKTSQ